MNKNYLKYLFKNYRIGLVFYAVLFLCIAGTPFIGSNNPGGSYSSAVEIMLAMSFAMTFVMPVILFAFVHRRRSADLFLALPISRKDQLLTNLLFALITVVGIFCLGNLIIWIPAAAYFSFTDVMRMCAAAALCFTSLILIHSAWYLIANNIFDGVVMIGAWSAIPLLLYFTISEFTGSMIAGRSSFDLYEISMSLSPLAMSVRNLFSINDITNGGVVPAYFVLILLWGVIGALGVWKHFVRRKSERAEQLSDDPLAYPLIINFYALFILIAIACAAVSERSFELISIYLSLLFIYVVAQFVYRRKIRVSVKTLVTFGAMSLAALIFALAAFNTQGFGLAQRYTIDDNTHLHISYNAMVYRDDLSMLVARNYPTDGDIVWINMDLFIPVKDYEADEPLNSVLEKTRQNGIAYFYSDERGADINCVIDFNNCDHNRQKYSNDYYYALNEAISLEDLKVIDSSPFSQITLQTYEDDRTWTLKQWLERNGN